MAKENVQKLKASELELKEKVVNIRRVTKVTKGGRTFTFSATVVVGNGKVLWVKVSVRHVRCRRLSKRQLTMQRKTW
jgi:hypothetical protein